VREARVYSEKRRRRSTKGGKVCVSSSSFDWAHFFLSLRYSNMDYVFASVLRHHSSKLSKIGSYDIACQWSIKLIERLKRLPPLVRLHHILSLTFVIPKLHIYGHKLKCQLNYSFHYHPGAGNTDGEGIERSHSYIGPMGMMTREMGPGSRHDTLDDGWGFWNWLKLVSLRRFICVLLLDNFTNMVSFSLYP
jgi:Kyakuja-Dileera-Zisupton transposase